MQYTCKIEEKAVSLRPVNRSRFWQRTELPSKIKY